MTAIMVYTKRWQVEKSISKRFGLCQAAFLILSAVRFVWVCVSAGQKHVVAIHLRCSSSRAAQN